MARLYESPTIERVGGDDWTQPVSAILVLFVYVLAVAAKVASVLNITVGVNVGALFNTFAMWNWAWFWSKKKKRK